MHLNVPVAWGQRANRAQMYGVPTPFHQRLSFLPLPLPARSSCMMQIQANSCRQDRMDQELWQLRMQLFTAMEGVGRASGRLDGMAMEMDRLNGVLERTNQGIQGLQATMQTILQRLDGGQ